MSWVESDAIVLRHVKQGDTSRVVTLFARETGKVAVLAKGCRRPGARLAAGLGLFHLTRIQYRPRANRDLVFLQSCDLRESFGALAQDVLGYAAAGVCTELVDRMVPDGAASTEIFDLLAEALGILSQTGSLPAGEELRFVAFPTAFQMKLMDYLGISPELTGCVGCHRSDLGGALSLSASRGGLLCPRCRASEGGQRVGADSVEFLRGALFGELSRVMTWPRPPSRALVLESRAALDSLLEYHHHVRPSALRSRKFLDGLWKTEGRG